VMSTCDDSSTAAVRAVSVTGRTVRHATVTAIAHTPAAARMPAVLAIHRRVWERSDRRVGVRPGVCGRRRMRRATHLALEGGPSWSASLARAGHAVRGGDQSRDHRAPTLVGPDPAVECGAFPRGGVAS